MPKSNWNNFTAKHPQAICFAGAVSSSLPKGLHFDRKGKKLPTPYGLFCEWASSNLKGDWTSMIAKGRFIIKVADQTDAVAIDMKFGASQLRKNGPGCAVSHNVHYRDMDYVNLAKSLGYDLP